MKKAYSALMAVIIMGAVMMIVALTLVNLGGDSAELSVLIADRYYVRNLARSCSEKGLRYLRSQEDFDEVENYQARKMFEPSDDTMIRSSDPGLSYGATPALALSNTSALLYRFKINEQLPLGAEVESAVLRLYATAAQDQAASIKVYRILPANANWLEGNNNGTPTSFFEANWNWLDYGALATWAGAAGMSSAGTDYYSIPEASLTLATASSTAYDWELNTETVNDWLEAETNPGLVLRTDSAGWFWFASKEASAINQRPVLDVVYTADDWLSKAGGIKQDAGYCFYQTEDIGNEQWLIKTTAISGELWSFEQVRVTKPTSTSGVISIESWQEVTGH